MFIRMFIAVDWLHFLIPYSNNWSRSSESHALETLSTFPKADGESVGFVVGTSISGGSMSVSMPSFLILKFVFIASTAFGAPAVPGVRVNAVGSEPVSGIVMDGAPGVGVAGAVVPGVAGAVAPGVAGAVVPGVAGAVVPGVAGAVVPGVAGAIVESIPSIISRSFDPHIAHMKSSKTTITNMLKYGLFALNTFIIILYFIIIIML